jgi:hypothetical protein
LGLGLGVGADGADESDEPDDDESLFAGTVEDELDRLSVR